MQGCPADVFLFFFLFLLLFSSVLGGRGFLKKYFLLYMYYITLFRSVLKIHIILLIMLGFTEKREPPKFVKKLETYEVVETETIRMEVQVTGKPKPHVTWSVQLFFDKQYSSCIFVYYASLYHHLTPSIPALQIFCMRCWTYSVYIVLSTLAFFLVISILSPS